MQLGCASWLSMGSQICLYLSVSIHKMRIITSLSPCPSGRLQTVKAQALPHTPLEFLNELGWLWGGLQKLACVPTGPIRSPQLPSCAAWASPVSCLMTGARTLPKPSPFSSKKECEDSLLHFVLKNEQQRKTFNQFDKFFLKSVWPLHIIFDKLYSCKILHNHRLTLFCNT